MKEFLKYYDRLDSIEEFIDRGYMYDCNFYGIMGHTIYRNDYVFDRWLVPKPEYKKVLGFGNLGVLQIAKEVGSGLSVVVRADNNGWNKIEISDVLKVIKRG